ncbi:MAG TPA: hypothetical protein VG937_22495 [Polyangiaceae bacterium]|nr:hypothetical protein [Polyangiaceae bacterium]
MSRRHHAGLRLTPASLLFLIFGALVALPAFAARGESASVQGCNTRCQTEQTDCALRCDGDIPCIQGCQKTADSCVEKCQGKSLQCVDSGSAPLSR